MTHQSALALANAQGNGWRLPSVKELASLIKVGGGAGIDTVVFPGTFGRYWSSTPAVSIGGAVVWSVGHGDSGSPNGLFNGIVNGSRLEQMRVRLVRDAP